MSDPFTGLWCHLVIELNITPIINTHVCLVDLTTSDNKVDLKYFRIIQESVFIEVLWFLDSLN